MNATRFALAMGLPLLLRCVSAHAQVVRVTGVTTLQYVDVRPLEDDSILATEAVGGGLLQRSPDGFVVRCITGEEYCRYKRPSSTASLLPVVQELEASAWGIGRGVKAYGRLRVGGMIGGNEMLWPRGADHLDVLAVYLEVDRSFIRGRLGRQWVAGVGYYNYDGLSLLFRPFPGLRVEAFGGRPLIRTIDQPLPNDELLALESFAPEEAAYFIGAQVRLRANRRAALNAVYQRELRQDRLAYYSERAGLDGFFRFGAASVNGLLQVDWGTGTVNEGLLRLQLPPLGPVTFDVFGRRHVPYFELWTIWGAFSPVAFTEAGGTATWRPTSYTIELSARGAARRYQQSHADQLFGDVRSDGWRLGASAAFGLGSEWTIDARYDAEIGFGAARSDLGARLQRSFASQDYAALNITAFQKRYELRVDEPTVFGVGVEAGVSPFQRTQILFALTAYRISDAVLGPDASWTQLRGYFRFVWTLGAEPGLRDLMSVP